MDSEKRREARVKTRFEALYASERVEGTGVLADLSYRGARIENPSLWLRPGAHARLYVFVRPVAPFELVGTVVRVDEHGFAVEFEKLDDELRALVDDAAAVVRVPSRD